MISYFNELYLINSQYVQINYLIFDVSKNRYNQRRNVKQILSQFTPYTVNGKLQKTDILYDVYNIICGQTHHVNVPLQCPHMYDRIHYFCEATI